MSVAALLLIAGQAAPFPAAPVENVVLAGERGGFRLPNGIDVALTVQTQTAIDGALVLRTVFRVDQGAPTTTVFVPTAGRMVAASSAGNRTDAEQAAIPVVTYDRQYGLQIAPGATARGLAVTSGSQHADTLPDGLEQAVVPDGGLATDRGLVTRTSTGDIQKIAIESTGLRITHLSGAAFGSAIENATNGRTIDVTTSVAIDLRNAGPDVLGSSMARVQNIALDALSLRGN